MTENPTLQPANFTPTLFPLAPEDARPATAGKRPAKKAAKKAVKKAAKKSAKSSSAADAPAPAPIPAVAPAEDAAPARKRPAKKAARAARPVSTEAELPAMALPAAVAPDGGVMRAPAADVPREASMAPPPAPVQPKPVEAVAAPAPAPAPASSSSPQEGQARPAANVQQQHEGRERHHGQHQRGEGQHQRGEGQPPHQQGQSHGGPQGKYGRKWEKRNKFRDRHRDGQQRDGHRDQPRDGQRDNQQNYQRDPRENQRDASPDSRQGDGYQAQPERPLGPPEPSEGILELTPKGYGFLRQKSRQWADFAQDPWVSPELIRNLGLRTGMYIKGVERMGHRGPQVTEITDVNGLAPEKVRDLPLFEELKAVNPNKRIQLETDGKRLTTRVMDLITPVGRGQRGLIVAPPRAGKTTLLQHIAEAITQNHPQMHLMILLVDERPEEVTEFRRTLPNAELHASSNDSDIRSHLRTAVLAIERAKRLVECGQHVFVLLDSITRMARAFNNAHKGGATATGGLGVGALELPRRLFAAARNTRDAGSLTILATTLIETNSRMDEAIFQEFKGTGNLELVLDRKIAEQYIYPAVNIFRSGTRREELLLPPFQMEKVHMLRRGLAGHKPIDAIQRVITLMERSPNNSQMLIELPGRVNV